MRLNLKAVSSRFPEVSFRGLSSTPLVFFFALVFVLLLPFVVFPAFFFLVLLVQSRSRNSFASIPGWRNKIVVVAGKVARLKHYWTWPGRREDTARIRPGITLSSPVLELLTGEMVLCLFLS